MFLNILCFIYYSIVSIESIPSIYRIWKRKSSENYSLMSSYLSMTGTIAWTMYVYSTKQSIMVYLGTAFDFVMAAVYTFFIIRYHNPKTE